MATTIISDDEFDSLLGIVDDPEKAKNLSLAQLREVNDLMTAYQEDRTSKRQRLVDEGLSREQIERIDAARDEFEGAPTSGVGPGARGVTPLQLEGFKEGLIEAVEGTFDLAKDISVGFHIEDEESRFKWKAAVAEDRTQRRVAQIEEFGQLSSTTTEFIGNMMPWMFATAETAATFTGLIAKRMVQGGFIGGTLMQQENESLVDRAVGMTVGAGLGTVGALFATPQALKLTIARNFQRAFNRGDLKQTERIERLVQDMTESPEFGLSVAQASGDRFILGLETQAAGVATKQAQNRNSNTLVAHLIKMARALSGQGKSATEVAIALRETMKRARKSIYKSASDDFKAGTQAILETHGDEVILRGQTYLAKIDKMIGEEVDRLANVGGKPSKELIAYREAVDTIVNPAKVVKTTTLVDKKPVDVWFIRNRRDNIDLPASPDKIAAEMKALEINTATGGVNSEESLRILKGLNKLIGGDAIIFENATIGSNRNTGRALMGNFIDELKHNPTNAKAAEDVIGLRTMYKDQMARAQAIDDTVIAAAFGGKKFPRKPGKRLDAVLKGEKEDLVAVREFLDEWNPELLDDLRATHLKRIVQKSQSGSGASVDTRISMTKLAKNLEDVFGGAGKTGRGLHTLATQRDMRLTADAIRVLTNKYFKGIAPGGTRIDDLAINIISRSPEFMARFLTRVVTSGRSMEAVLLDPATRKALQNLANTGPTDRLGKASMIYLAGFINNNIRIQDARDREEEQQRQDSLSRR